nr:hypothetical protein [Tanacetum cinerariifolium]
MSAMGELNFFLSLQVLQKEDGIFLSQDKYVGDILKKFRYSDFRSSNTPMDKENPWVKTELEKMHQVTPKECHLHAVKRIFRYLKVHPKLGLWYPKESPFDLVAYSDSDYGGATQDYISTTRGCQFLGRRLSMLCEALSREISSSILRFNTIMARLQFCDYHNMVAILEKCEHNIDFHLIVDFVEASPLMYASTVKPTVYVSHIRQFWSTVRIETTEEGTKILATVDGILRTVTESSLRRNLKLQDEEGISSLPDTELFENLTLIGYNISPNQKFTFLKGTYNFSKMIYDGFVKNVNKKGKGSGTPTEPHHTPSLKAHPTSHTTYSSPTHSPVPTASIPTITPSKTTLIRQYTRRARIVQSSALLPVADEPASPLRDVSKGEACPTDSGFGADQDRANIAKTSTLPYDSVPRVTSPTADKGIAERVSNDTEEMATVLTSMETATVLASGAVEVPTGSGSIPTAGSPATEVPTGSDVVPTASPVFATATMVTLYRRRKGKEIMVDFETPKKKKVQEQIDAHVARELEEKMTREDQRMSEQVARDAEVARIHAEEELQMMINSLDISNGTVLKYLQEYEQFTGDLSIGKRAELINNLIKYQENYAQILKFQTQQRKPWSKKKKSDYYMAVIKSNLGWKMKDFRGMIFEEIEAKFTTESVKKLKPSEEVPEEAKSPDEVPEKKKVYTEGQRAYWKITRLGSSSASYQFFIDLLKHIDREDLNQLWALVKESFSNRQPTSDKEMELWVELKRLYEPDDEDQLWTHTQNLMHAPVEWKLYDMCGVHQVTSKDKEIFMLVEKDYPLRKGLEIMMICYKLQVENYS